MEWLLCHVRQYERVYTRAFSYYYYYYPMVTTNDFNNNLQRRSKDGKFCTLGCLVACAVCGPGCISSLVSVSTMLKVLGDMAKTS